MRQGFGSARGLSSHAASKFLSQERTKPRLLRLLAALFAFVAAVWFLRHFIRGKTHDADAVSKAILLCEQNQENLQEFSEIARTRLGLDLILAEPKLLELVVKLEKEREEHVANRTRQFGQPEVMLQSSGKVLTWHHAARDNSKNGGGGADPDSVVSSKSVVDYSLPLTVFGDPRLVCNQWRTSFVVFHRSGLALANATILPRMSWQLAELADSMQKAGFSVATFEGEDERLSSAGVGMHLHAVDSLLYHLRFFRGKHNIYLTILYERSEPNYFWNAALVPVNGTKSPVHFGFHAGSWQRFGSREVQLDFGTTLHVPNGTQRFLDDFLSSKFIGCNLGRAEQFFRSYPPQADVAEEADFVKNAVRVLKLGRSALDELNVPFWISSGTCLGWFRQCSVIPHSKDVDFGIFVKDYHEHIVMHLLMKGFRLKHWFGKMSDSLELSFVLDGIKLDLFFFYEANGYMWNGGTQARTGKKFKYIFPKFSLCWTEFVGLRVRVPCQTQSYVEANYGLSWDEPVKQWDWKASPPNVRDNGQWNESEWKKVIQVY